MAKRLKNLKVRLSQKVIDDKDKCEKCRHYIDEFVDNDYVYGFENECLVSGIKNYDIRTQKNCKKFSKVQKCIDCLFYGFSIAENTNTCAKRKIKDFDVRYKRYCKKKIYIYRRLRHDKI